MQQVSYTQIGVSFKKVTSQFEATTTYNCFEEMPEGALQLVQHAQTSSIPHFSWREGCCGEEGDAPVTLGGSGPFCGLGFIMVAWEALLVAFVGPRCGTLVVLLCCC